MKEYCFTVECEQRTLTTRYSSRELLRYDYQWGLSSTPKRRNSAPGGVGNVDGKSGSVSARHPGQLYLELRGVSPEGKWEIVDIRDLRKGLPVLTDELVTIKVYRRRNKIDWTPKLAQLAEFLQSCDADSVRIRHHYPE